LLYAAEIDYAVPSGAKEGGRIQPALTFSKWTPDQGGGIGQIHARVISTGLESRDVRSADHPALHIVAQKDEVVVAEYSTVILREIVLEFGSVIVLEFGAVRMFAEVWRRLTMACGRKPLEMARSSLAERGFVEIVEDHKSVVANQLPERLSSWRLLMVGTRFRQGARQPVRIQMRDLFTQ
jgi:hypothetical protein